jgi:hypothetical protein
MSGDNPSLLLQGATSGRKAKLESGTASSVGMENKKQRSHVVTPPNGNDESNPYLALRQANIARNEARLRELGLLHEARKPSTKRSRSTSDPKSTTSSYGHPNQSTSGHSAVARLDGGEWKADVPTPAEEGDDDIEALPVSSGTARPLRRSRRTLGRSVDYKEVSHSTTTTRVYDGIKLLEGDEVATDVFEPDGEVDDDDIALASKNDKRVSTARAPTAAASFAPNSARNIALDVHRLVIDPENGWLGKPMEATGKAIVMETAAQLFATEQHFHRKISFNKYSGVQDWKRGIFLWVNLGGPNNTVANDFIEGGRQMTWYGGARMKPTSSMIQNLVRVGKPTDDMDGIVLWCRRYEAVKRNFGPYYCLGRLAYQSHNPNVMPVTFVWSLVDYEALMQTGSKVAKEMITT